MKAETQYIKNNLGLVCITTTAAVRYKTVTRKRFLSFDEAGRREKLREIYAANTATLRKAVEFCLARGINLYRMTSGLFPFSDEEIGIEISFEFADELAAIGTDALSTVFFLLAMFYPFTRLPVHAI